ncbi:MAG TPA: hypothetical protein VFA57_01155 [Pseudolabrys sp.]|nr:hypothetical protein [Pseudolabrys sp.]
MQALVSSWVYAKAEAVDQATTANTSRAVRRMLDVLPKIPGDARKTSTGFVNCASTESTTARCAGEFSKRNLRPIIQGAYSAGRAIIDRDLQQKGFRSHGFEVTDLVLEPLNLAIVRRAFVFDAPRVVFQTAQKTSQTKEICFGGRFEHAT